MSRILEQKDTLVAEESKTSEALQISVTSDSAISRGQVTLCYLANDDISKRGLFLKQFKQPSPRVDWYSNYLDYLSNLADRIDATPCKFLTCKIFKVFEHKNSIFEAMEFLNGISLKKYLELHDFSRLTPADYKSRVQIAVCFIGALKAFHAAGIVHTDLKPDNIFLETTPTTKFGFTVKLIDLDYAIMEDAPSLPWQEAQSQAIAGTPGYFPPERYTGEKYGKHSDIFTAGVILQEILCSNTPFPKDEYDNLVNPAKRSAKPQQPMFPPFINRKVADGMSALLYQCLAQNKNSRPNADSLHKTLIQFQKAVDSNVNSNEVIAQPVLKTQHFTTPVVVLQGPSGAMVFNNSTSISASELQNIDSSAAQIADRICQFQILLQGESFYLKPNPSANSTVLVNGQVVETRQSLLKGDIITISNDDTDSNEIRVDIKN